MAKSNLYVNIPGATKIQIDNDLVEINSNSNFNSQSICFTLPTYGYTDGSTNQYFIKANSGQFKYWAMPASNFYDLPYYYNGMKVPFALKGSAPMTMQGYYLIGSKIIDYIGSATVTITCKTYNNRPALYNGSTFIKYGNAAYFMLSGGGGAGGSPSNQTAVHGSAGGGGGAGGWAIVYVAFKKANTDAYVQASLPAASSGAGGAATLSYFNGDSSDSSHTILTCSGGTKGGSGSRSYAAGGSVNTNVLSYDGDNIYIYVVMTGDGAKGGYSAKQTATYHDKPTAGSDLTCTYHVAHSSTAETATITGGYCYTTLHANYVTNGGGGGASIFETGGSGAYYTNTTSSSSGAASTAGAKGSGGGGAAVFNWTGTSKAGANGGAGCLRIL